VSNLIPQQVRSWVEENYDGARFVALLARGKKRVARLEPEEWGTSDNALAELNEVIANNLALYAKSTKWAIVIEKEDYEASRREFVVGQEGSEGWDEEHPMEKANRFVLAAAGEMTRQSLTVIRELRGFCGELMESQRDANKAMAEASKVHIELQTAQTKAETEQLETLAKQERTGKLLEAGMGYVEAFVTNKTGQGGDDILRKLLASMDDEQKARMLQNLKPHQMALLNAAMEASENQG
jgi:hypothetical protein